MFDIGFWEITLILVMALIVLGPERLPQAARTVGRWVGKARRYIEGVKSEVEKEFDAGELKRMLHNQEVQIRELQSKLTDSEDYINKDYHNLFEDSDDPGTAPGSEPEYDIIEEDDDEYHALEDSPKKQSKSGSSAPDSDSDQPTSEKPADNTPKETDKSE